MLLSSILLVTWCGKKQDTTTVQSLIEDGDTVAVNYTLSLSDGSVKDTSYQDIAEKNAILATGRVYEPLKFTIGQKQMIPGFEKGLLWMKEKESKKITVSPEDWYGLKDDKLVQNVSGSVFTEAWITPKVGDVFNFQFAPWKVLQISWDIIVIDFNHPLAGESLIFDVTVESIVKWVPTTWGNTAQ